MRKGILGVMAAMAFALPGVVLADEAREGDLKSQLQQELGDGWSVKERASGFVAERKSKSMADADFAKQVRDEIREIDREETKLKATHTGDEVRLQGRLDSCGELANEAEEFSDINGVNRIVVSAKCGR